MIALVASIERYEARQGMFFQGSGGQSWRYGSHQVRRKAPGREILCFGDSQVNFGVVPAVLQEQTGKRAYNLAIHGGSAPSSYFLLKHAFAAGSRPATVVVDFHYQILAEGPGSTTRVYPWAELVSASEALDLSWTARDPDLLATILVQRSLPSANSRFQLRDQIVKALRAEPDQRAATFRLVWRNWNQNDGALIKPKDPDFHEDPVPPQAARRLPGRWRCDRTNARYVERFLELAARIGARVYWLLPPVTPLTQFVYDDSGDQACADRYIQRLQARHTHLVVIDGRHAGYTAEVFLDGVHLNREGAVALSTGIGQILRASRDQPTLGTRWIDLPAYTPPSSRARVEDLGASYAALHSRPARRRR
jgi:hypothetical protein